MYCQIRVKGHLSASWSAWYGGLTINNDPNGQASLSGHLPDYAALYGLLNRLYALNLPLLALECNDNSPPHSPLDE